MYKKPQNYPAAERSVQLITSCYQIRNLIGMDNLLIICVIQNALFNCISN
jgi:hypothetical protein